MKGERRAIAIAALRWTVGIVVLLQSARLALDVSANENFARMGAPVWVRPSLAFAEFAAAVLFLLPLTRTAGGYSLLVVFAVAALLHILHGEFDIASLAVYATAVIAGMAYDKQGVAVAK